MGEDGENRLRRKIKEGNNMNKPADGVITDVKGIKPEHVVLDLKKRTIQVLKPMTLTALYLHLLELWLSPEMSLHPFPINAAHRHQIRLINKWEFAGGVSEQLLWISKPGPDIWGTMAPVTTVDADPTSVPLPVED